ncbi:unnamed protein product [Aureobasidium pullulans]|nr:unnamed protein product [Aureobasidium pullulans]
MGLPQQTTTPIEKPSTSETAENMTDSTPPPTSALRTAQSAPQIHPNWLEVLSAALKVTQRELLRSSMKREWRRSTLSAREVHK